MMRTKKQADSRANAQTQAKSVRTELEELRRKQLAQNQRKSFAEGKLVCVDHGYVANKLVAMLLVRGSI
jgi:hypothetical protein